MSEAQERRRAESWEAHGKQSHERSIARLQEMKAQLDRMNPESDEYKVLKATYDDDNASAEAYFVKYYES